MEKRGKELRIAICDDDIRERDEVVSVLQAYSLQKEISFIYHLFENGFSLLESVEAGTVYDIIVLDILMPGMTGIETARQIRKANEAVKIIFLTSSADFAVDSYAVGAYYYLLKPVEKKNFFYVLEKAFRSKKQKDEASIIVNDGRTIKRIVLAELVYCEIMRRTICYHLEDKTVIQASGTLTELERTILHYINFTKPHRSYLVNLRHVTEVTPHELKTDIGEAVPLSRRRYDEICHAFLTHAFEGETG